jgi:diaminohydroxyphosphoribosylaminopyrimidine deaminase/5-amino-6-(5-phosphoribosylamino)uracil reductase
MTAPSADAGRREKITSHGAEVLDVSTVAGRLWLPSVMEALVARGISRLLGEGGPIIWQAFARAALVDEVILYMAGAPTDADAQKVMARHLGPLEFEIAGRSALGADTMWRLRPATAKEGR